MPELSEAALEDLNHFASKYGCAAIVAGLVKICNAQLETKFAGDLSAKPYAVRMEAKAWRTDRDSLNACLLRMLEIGVGSGCK